MDNQKFGQFIQKRRKEKGWTQQDLAERLHVTDKAVSKWERGIGFPDIKMIEPLAEVLGVTIPELMCSEKDEGVVQASKTAEAISNVIDVAEYQKKMERRNILLAVVWIAAVVMAIFLLDTMQWTGILMVCVPGIFLVVGIYLVGLSIYRARRKRAYGRLLVVGMIVGLLPVLFFLVLFVCAMAGVGPIPT